MCSGSRINAAPASALQHSINITKCCDFFRGYNKYPTFILLSLRFPYLILPIIISSWLDLIISYVIFILLNIEFMPSASDDVPHYAENLTPFPFFITSRK
jgi:hypothetical protein